MSVSSRDVPSKTQPTARNRFGSPRLPRWRRPLLIVGAGIAVVALVVGTWFVAALFESPAQREANAAAPLSQPVFAVVEKGRLVDQRSYPGTVAYSNEVGFTLTAADAMRSVVTGNPAPVGGRVSSGELLTEVNTRPVFLVASPFDFFRDIGFGDEGADVRALQEALVDRGYLGRADGSYGAATAFAVVRWYRDAGYVAPTRQRPTTNATSPDPSPVQGGADGSGSSGSSGSSGEPGSVGSGAPSKPLVDAFVPFRELLGVPSLPAIVIAAPAIGAHVGGQTPDLTLGTSTLIVRSEVPGAEAAGMKPGDRVTVVASSAQADAVVAAVEAQPPGKDGTPRPSVLTVSFGTDPAAPTSGRGATVTVQVQNAVVAEESLIVPTAAVVGRGEGRGVVVKRQADGSLIEVPVTVAGSLRGRTAIAADDGRALTDGDDVRVG